jgi:protocatechuate 3,4-dioxygenase beta subunit
MRKPQPRADLTWSDVQAVLDAALGDLPEKYRAALVLCQLEGHSHAEAAQRLGCPLATLRTRVSRGRALLRKQLTSRGLTLSAGGLATLLLANAAPAAAPGPLVKATLQAALPFATGQSAAAVCSTSVAGLVEGGLKSMLLTKIKSALLVLLAAGLLAGGGAVLGQLLPADQTGVRRGSAESARRGFPDPAETADRRSPPSRPAVKDPQENSTVTYRGRVLNPQGKPVAGARLYVPRRRGELARGQDEAALVERGRTDAQGAFHLDLPRREAHGDRPVPLVAAADGFGLAWLDLPPADRAGELTLRLVKDVPIHGHVVTSEGKPVVGATVDVVGVMAFTRLDDFLRVFQREGGHADEGTGARRLEVSLTPALHVTPTDRNGRFEVRGAGAERLVGLRVENAAVGREGMTVVTREGLDLKALNQRFVAKSVQGGGRGVAGLVGPSFEYVALPARSIEGRVREAGGGKPVAGATIMAFGATTTSDARGHYRLRGVRKAAEYTLHVTGPRDVPLLGRSVRLADVTGLGPINADIELTRGVLITGRVVDKATGKGVECSVHFSLLPGIKSAARAAGQALYTSTDAEGRFRLVTVPGPGVVLATVAGRAFKINGVPVGRYKQAEFDAADRRRVQMRGTHRSFATADGTEDLGFSNACKVVDVPEGGGPVTCDLMLDPGRTATVHLEDPEGKPLPGVLAAGVSSAALRAVPLTTATCPVYTLDPVRPRRMVFLHPGRKLAAVATVRGDERGPVTVRLKPAATVTGRALDAEGQPLAGAEVHMIYGGEAGGQLSKMAVNLLVAPRTDRDGRFRLDGVMPGVEVELLGFVKGQEVLVARRLKGLKSLAFGKTLDLGDVPTQRR